MAEHDAPGPDEPRQGAGEDPTRESAWDDVAAQFSSLGKQLRRRFEQPGAATGEAAGTDPSASQEPTAEAREGARRWIDALDDTFTKLGDTVRDPEFRKEAGTSVSRLGEALGASLRDLGEQLQRKFGARHDPPGSAGERMPDVPPPPASTPPAGGPAGAPPAGGGPAGGPPPPPAGGTPPPAAPVGDPPPAPPAGGTPPPVPPADRPQDPPQAP